MMQVLQAMNSSRLNETGAFRFTLMLNSLLSFHNDLFFLKKHTDMPLKITQYFTSRLDEEKQTGWGNG